MKYLEYEVNNMNISRKPGDKTVLISGAKNYFGLHFTFDEEFSAIAGAKKCEFFKNRKLEKIDLIDGACAIPNEFLTDKNSFEIRVVSGTTVATPWVVVSITESGSIMTDEPDEEAETGTEYVKTPSEKAVPYIRVGDNGFEYSVDGINWKKGINGVPDVPSTPADNTYARKNGDWVPIDDAIMTGTATAIAELAPSADLATVINKINEIIGIMNDRGITTTT